MTSQEPVLLKEPRGGVPDVIDTPDQFYDMVDRFDQADGPIAADAERASGYRYGQQDWLVQFKRTGAGIALVDPVALAEQGVSWQPFNDAVGDAPWIIHDSLQDLPGFVQIGMTPRSLFDTEMAARLLGCQRFGLAACTERFLGLTLAKEHSAADWSYRPLARDLRDYAALDVEVLIELRARMLEQIKAQGKMEWAREEFDYLLATGTAPKPEQPEPWRHTSYISRLKHDRRGLAIVRELWEERDRQARELDIAPSLLLPDSAIIKAATAKPRNNRQFASIRVLNERVRMHVGDERDKMFERYAPLQRKVKPSVWKDAILRALALPASQLPAVNREGQEGGEGGKAPRSLAYWRKHHPDRFALLEKERARLNQIGQDTNTPADVLLRPQIVRNLCWQAGEGVDLTTAELVEEFLLRQGARHWQAHLLGAALAQQVRQAVRE
ncbi:MAG: HRDC domain-containing protein [Bifidobacteriaceae bacterium]|nr:HRDC domain-containing protein [Bifidobacteriaceae bacterium]